MRPLKLARKLQSLPDLGTHQVAASQLATNGMDGNCIYQSNHIGRIVAVRRRETYIVGPLRSVMDSMTPPLLVLGIGDFTTAVHPTHPVTVAPEGCRLKVVASTEGGDEA